MKQTPKPTPSKDNQSQRESLTPLGEIISCLFSGQHLPFCLEDARILEVWPDVMGELVQYARPVVLTRGKLRVEVSDPIWIQELKFLEKEIMEKLNQALGKRAVKGIEFRLRRG